MCVCRRRCSLSILDVCLFASATRICVFMCVRERESLCVLPLLFALQLGQCLSASATYICVCVCVREKKRKRKRECVHVCVCVRERVFVSRRRYSL